MFSPVILALHCVCMCVLFWWLAPISLEKKGRVVAGGMVVHKTGSCAEGGSFGSGLSTSTLWEDHPCVPGESNANTSGGCRDAGNPDYQHLTSLEQLWQFHPSLLISSLQSLVPPPFRNIFFFLWHRTQLSGSGCCLHRRQFAVPSPHVDLCNPACYRVPPTGAAGCFPKHLVVFKELYAICSTSGGCHFAPDSATQQL